MLECAYFQDNSSVWILSKAYLERMQIYPLCKFMPDCRYKVRLIKSPPVEK